ncbi:MAG: hypothetical protein WCL02_09030 [bacterium]
MPTKKPVKKAVAATKRTVSTVEVKAKSFAKDLEKEAKVIKSEGKEIGSKIGIRREVSTTEEKIFTIIGIILLIFGIYSMRQFLGATLLIVLGILFVTGFFMKRKK